MPKLVWACLRYTPKLSLGVASIAIHLKASRHERYCPRGPKMINPSDSAEAGMELALELALPDEAATEALGRALGPLLGPGDVVLLVGGLGAGKTTLSRGLARGLGVDEAYAITSPTFTLLNVYPGRAGPAGFFHADLYRLEAEGAAELELLDEAAAGVLAVEWPEQAGDVWPAEALRVELAPQGENARRARVSGPRALVERLARSLHEEE